ncbi:Uncharacterised protein [Vibrio cholerae]|uniref:Uncharacterized protein n=1 Tax=Vibrio cholerae TaxID=666 RepID=A0A655R183_VIBCL|nr:Uncharacterised protein [Vibrio cholerae]CSC51699.1 Uncharacterised protein [Vibrio cholerae]CSC83178.1 Uncharacterised protein [Vibrio cholerae]CSC99377.1 Uncharacterised protein [Vibrio cholerae]CSI39996.1 Uncharacterised protein [Vibrio cholerae]
MPALACCTAWPPVSAPKQFTYPFFAEPFTSSHSLSAPRWAMVLAGTTEPRKLTTSSAV